MKRLLLFFLLLSLSIVRAQRIEMTPAGFTPLTVSSPNKPVEKLIELSRSWAGYYNRDGYDVFDVTEQSLSISALKRTACYYYNLGVRYDYDVRYTLKIVFNADKTYTLTFTPNEFYAGNVLTKTTVPDFFLPDGRLKEDYRDVKPSLEATVERIVKSYSAAIAKE